MAQMNAAYVAHIVADSPDGPRGDPVLSKKLAKELSNLMLLCDAHHRLIDIEDVAGHPAALLNVMKQEHEQRIEMLTGIQTDRSSHVLLYGANIGDYSSPLQFDSAKEAMVPSRYPAGPRPISLGMVDSSGKDRDADYWAQEVRHLERQFETRVKQPIADGTVRHLSVFGLAPQPLLIRLGTLLTDIAPANVFQLHREPTPGWAWPEPAPPEPAFRLIAPPANAKGPATLILSLSATVTNDRIADVLGADVAPWRIELPEPRHDCIGAPEHLSILRALLRRTLDQIKAKHGGDAPLHIFPAAPVSTMVELGRVRQPKADMAWHIYDENRAHGGFVNAIQIAQEQ